MLNSWNYGIQQIHWTGASRVSAWAAQADGRFAPRGLGWVLQEGFLEKETYEQGLGDEEGVHTACDWAVSVEVADGGLGKGQSKQKEKHSSPQMCEIAK